MANEKQRRAFISYSRINKEFATKLVKGLRAGGYPVWFDLLDIPTGSRWDDEVEKALRECSIFMIILTPASIASENVKDEIGYAIDHGKRILPVLLEECDVPLRLRRFQYVDFTTKSFEEGFESAKGLLRDLVEEASVPLPPKAPVNEAPVDQNAAAERLAKQQADEALAAKSQAESEWNAPQKHETTDFSVEREKVLKASTLMAQGKELLQTGELSQAVQVFQQILTLMPNHEKTLTLLAEAEAGILQERESIDRNIKQEADRLAAQKVEEKQLAQAKVKIEHKAREESEKLAVQNAEREVKAEADRLAKQKAEDKQLANAKAKDEADQIPAQAPQWSAVAWITLGWIIGFLFIAYNFRDYYNNRGYTSPVDTFMGALGGAVIGLGIALTLKAHHTISNWKSMLWITLIAAISFSIAVVRGEPSQSLATNGAIYGAIGGFGIAFVLRNVHIIPNWKSMLWISLFFAVGSSAGLGTFLFFFFNIDNPITGGVIGGIIGGAISAFGLVLQIRKGINTDLPAESTTGKSETVSTITEQSDAGTKSRKTINDWLQIWWVRGLIVTIIMVVLGFVLFYLEQGWMDSSNNITIIVISIVFGVFGFMFYPHKISYILTAVFVVIGTIVWSPALYSFPLGLWIGLGSGFILSAIISRVLHAMKKI